MFSPIRILNYNSSQSSKFIKISCVWNFQQNSELFTRTDDRNPLTPSEAHCINVVKKFDYENFLATLFINGRPELRRTAFALRALNVELAQVRDTTKTNELAQIRFQFWQDVVDEIYNSSNIEPDEIRVKYRNFPLAAELFQVLTTSKLSKHWLTKLIQIRRDQKYLGEFPFQTLDELEKYCESSLVSLYYLLNEKSIELSSNSDGGYRITMDHLANHLGKAQGLTNILRGIVHNAKSRRCYIPNDILLKSKCSHENFLRCQDGDNVREAVYLVASKANGHLVHTEKLLKDNGKHPVRKPDRQLFSLPIIPVKSYLNDLEKFQFNIFDPRLFQRRGWLSWKMWWRSKIQ